MTSARDTIGRAYYKVRQDVDFLGKTISEESAKHLEDVGRLILELAQEYVPVQTGALRDSGKVVVAARGSGASTKQAVSVIFGGTSTTSGANNPTGNVHYAAIVHELHPTGRGFLSRAVQEVIASGESDKLLKARLRVLSRHKSPGTRGPGRAAPAHVKLNVGLG